MRGPLTLISSGRIAPYRFVHTDIPFSNHLEKNLQNLRSFERDAID